VDESAERECRALNELYCVGVGYIKKMGLEMSVYLRCADEEYKLHMLQDTAMT